MGLLNRFKESAAIRAIQATLEHGKSPEEAVAAARRLSTLGTERCIPALCQALSKDNPPLQIQAARALAAVYERHPDEQILKELNGSVLNERQPAQARQAAIESLASIVDFRHAGSLIEVLKSNRSPLPVRSAALRCLKRLHYPEILERLVESFLFAKRLDPSGEIRKWAARELIALDDHEKLTKLFEIVHGRRKLRYRPVDHEAGPGRLVLLMARIDPKASVRFLNQMVDDDNPVIRTAAAQALHDIKAKKDAAS